MPELKKQILVHIKKHHDENGKVPSLEVICKEVEGCNKTKFYKRFTGIAEACRLAGVPAPESRIKATKKARKTQKSKKKKQHVETKEVSLPGVVLTKDHVERFLSIRHLEKSKDMSEIIDKILDRDTDFREEKGMTLDNTKEVFDYIKMAKERKWTLASLISIQTRLWNAGIMSMSPQSVKEHASLLEKLKESGYDTDKISEILGRSFVKDFMPDISYDECVKFLDSLRAIWFKGLTISQYLNEVAKVRQDMELYQEYFNGGITYDQLKQTVHPND